MEEYAIPEHLLLLRDEAAAAGKLFKIYVKLPFCYKYALRASKTEVTSMRLFWGGIRKLYPILYGHTLQMDTGKKTVYILNEADNQ